jgi:hypothetical protein
MKVTPCPLLGGGATVCKSDVKQAYPNLNVGPPGPLLIGLLMAQRRRQIPSAGEKLHETGEIVFLFLERALASEGRGRDCQSFC